MGKQSSGNDDGKKSPSRKYAIAEGRTGKHTRTRIARVARRLARLKEKYEQGGGSPRKMSRRQELKTRYREAAAAYKPAPVKDSDFF